MPAPSSVPAPASTPGTAAPVASTTQHALPASSTPGPAPPRDPFEAEVEAFCTAEASPSVSADGKRLFHVTCLSAGDPPVSVARLTVTDVASGRETKSTDLADAGAAVRRVALAEMKAALAATRRLPLFAYRISDDDSTPERSNGLGTSRARVASGEGLTVKFHEPELAVTDDQGKVVHRRAHPAWSPRIEKLGQRCLMLTDLTGVMGNRATGILLVDLTSIGSPHFCEAQASRHIVQIPAKP